MWQTCISTDANFQVDFDSWALPWALTQGPRLFYLETLPSSSHVALKDPVLICTGPEERKGTQRLRFRSFFMHQSQNMTFFYLPLARTQSGRFSLSICPGRKGSRLGEQVTSFKGGKKQKQKTADVIASRQLSGNTILYRDNNSPPKGNNFWWDSSHHAFGIGVWLSIW